jgi:thioredoxin-like negative regulator of GroEL
MKQLRMVVALVVPVLTLWGAAPGTCSASYDIYSVALQSAGLAGKPLMIDFYTDWCPHCKEMDRIVAQIPDTMNKFVYIRINAERDIPLAKRFRVDGYPTVVFLKPDGSEFHRWSGAYQTRQDMTTVLLSVLKKAGPIEPVNPSAQQAQTATAPPDSPADAQLKKALRDYSLGRDHQAAEGFRQVIALYPDMPAAKQAREKLATVHDTAEEVLPAPASPSPVSSSAKSTP